MPASFELFQPAELYVPFGPWAATLPEDRGWHPGIFPIARLKDGVTIEQARVEMDTIARQLEARVSRLEQERPRAGQPRAGSAGAERPPGAVDAARRRGAGAADRVRERGQPAARPRGRPPEGDGGAAGDRRGPRADHPAAGDRKPGAGRAPAAAAGLLLAMGRCRCCRPRRSRGCRARRASPSTGRWRCSRWRCRWSPAWSSAPVPALQATRFDIRESLNEESRGGSEQRRAIAACGRRWWSPRSRWRWCCSSAPDCCCAAFRALTRVSPGFDPRNLLVINLPLSPRTYGDNVVRTAAVDRIVERVAALPGVERAAMTHDDADGRRRRDHPLQPRRLSAEGPGGLRDGGLPRRHAGLPADARRAAASAAG